jgi:hypothetical protein
MQRLNQSIEPLNILRVIPEMIFKGNSYTIDVGLWKVNIKSDLIAEKIQKNII